MFTFDENDVGIVDKYTYNNFYPICKTWRDLTNDGLDTYTKLYTQSASVIQIMHYGSAVLGIKNVENCDKIQQRVCRNYLGVH